MVVVVVVLVVVVVVAAAAAGVLVVAVVVVVAAVVVIVAAVVVAVVFAVAAAVAPAGSMCRSSISRNILARLFLQHLSLVLSSHRFCRLHQSRLKSEPKAPNVLFALR